MRAAVAAGFGAIVGGAELLEPHGLDFTALAPPWLALASFIAIPAAYGAMTSVLIERRLAVRVADETPRWTTFVPLLLLLLLGPVGFAIVAGAALAWVLTRRWPSLVTIWRSSAVTWIGRAALVGFAAIRMAELLDDLREIL